MKRCTLALVSHHQQYQTSKAFLLSSCHEQFPDFAPPMAKKRAEGLSIYSRRGHTPPAWAQNAGEPLGSFLSPRQERAAAQQRSPRIVFRPF